MYTGNRTCIGVRDIALSRAQANGSCRAAETDKRLPDQKGRKKLSLREIYICLVQQLRARLYRRGPEFEDSRIKEARAANKGGLK